jgi:CubicO group peptidase (beta-lactamase class C family)
VTDLDLDGLLAGHAARHGVPGASIGVLHDGVATVAHHGVADVSSGAPVTPESRFGAGSLTKSMVATATVLLAQAGGLSLGDPIAAHVPELGGAAWARFATVRDLLANRSPVPLSAALEFDPPGDGGDDVLERYAALVAALEPSTAGWSYANAGWCVLARALETICACPWEEALRSQVFERAGMDATGFGADSPEGARVAGHRVADGDAVPTARWRPRALGPAGSTTDTTADDMLSFAALHLREPALTSMRAVGADVRLHGWFDAWCHGWARFDWQGGAAFGWDGLLPGERSFLRILPERRAAVVLLTNGSTGRAMYRSLFTELLEQGFGIVMPPLRLDPVAGAAGDLERFAGSYAWPDRRAEVRAAGDRLRIEVDGESFDARPIDERTFLVDRADPDTPTVTFGGFGPDGSPSALYLMLWGLPRQGGG